MKTKRNVVTLFQVVSLFCGITICNADGFDSVRCGSDVRKALVGHKMSNESVAVLEERHKDLELKDLGASEISDRLSIISWRGVRPSRRQRCRARPAQISETFKGVAPIHWFVSIKWPESPGHSIGVLKNEKGVETLAAAAAWKVDEKQMKFVQLQRQKDCVARVMESLLPTVGFEPSSCLECA